MKKLEYLQMLVEENTDKKTQALYNDIIDAVDIALSQMPDDFEVQNTKLGADDFYKVLQTEAQKLMAKQTDKKVPVCIGPFTAAELFAPMLGAHYQRATDRFKKKSGVGSKSVVRLEDLF